jgi:REP element-mobilizing transposase RayT
MVAIHGTYNRNIHELKNAIVVSTFWAIGYGVFSSGNVTDEMIAEYIAHHDEHSDNLDDIEVRP